jgi:hypothetical protein
VKVDYVASLFNLAVLFGELKRQMAVRVYRQFSAVLKL